MVPLFHGLIQSPCLPAACIIVMGKSKPNCCFVKPSSDTFTNPLSSSGSIQICTKPHLKPPLPGSYFSFLNFYF